MKALPDIIDFNLKILFIGFNPGLKSALLGHHYAGGSNNFWKLLYEAGLTPRRFTSEEDKLLLTLSLGSTNIVDRPTRGINEIKGGEFKEGAVELRRTLEKYKPQIACYVGIGVYKGFTGRKEVSCGLQEIETVAGVKDFVCSSPSGLNRMPYRNQLECFRSLKELACKI